MCNTLAVAQLQLALDKAALGEALARCVPVDKLSGSLAEVAAGNSTTRRVEQAAGDVSLQISSSPARTACGSRHRRRGRSFRDPAAACAPAEWCELNASLDHGTDVLLACSKALCI